MRILAIDPGYERLGIAILEKKNGKELLVYSNCFKTRAALPHAERLSLILTEIWRVVDEYKPERLAIETLLFNSNQKTALKVAEARGTVLAVAAKAGLKVFEYSPLQIKVAITGHGRSDKKQMIGMVKRLIAVPDTVVNDDEFDAIACGLTSLAVEKENFSTGK